MNQNGLSPALATRRRASHVITLRYYFNSNSNSTSSTTSGTTVGVFTRASAIKQVDTNPLGVICVVSTVYKEGR